MKRTKADIIDDFNHSIFLAQNSHGTESLWRHPCTGEFFMCFDYETKNIFPASKSFAKTWAAGHLFDIDEFDRVFNYA